MARPLRIQYEGALYHIISRGNGRKMIFLHVGDWRKFIKLMDTVVKRFGWICHAYCLMGNHYHLLIETPDGNLAKGMKYLNGVYSLWFNKKYTKVGHVMQGRYKAYIVEKEAYLLHCCRYIVLNPYEGGLVQHPEDWKWSSYRATAGIDKPEPFLTVDWILEMFASSKRKAQKAYTNFVEEGMTEDSNRLEYKCQIFLGSDTFIENVMKKFTPVSGFSDIPKKQIFAPKPSLPEILPDKHFLSKQERNRAIYNAYKTYGYTLKEIASYLGMNPNYLCRIINKK